MTSENPQIDNADSAELTSENREPIPKRRHGRGAVELGNEFSLVLDVYADGLRVAPLSDQTRRTYASKVRQYLAWLDATPMNMDPLESTDGRDWAVRDYRTHLQTVLKRRPATVNNALAAVDDFYPPGTRSGQCCQG